MPRPSLPRGKSFPFKYENALTLTPLRPLQHMYIYNILYIVCGENNLFVRISFAVVVVFLGNLRLNALRWEFVGSEWD